MKFLAVLNEIDVTTRYSETLEKMARAYPEKKVDEIMKKTREPIAWIKAQL